MRYKSAQRISQEIATQVSWNMRHIPSVISYTLLSEPDLLFENNFPHVNRFNAFIRKTKKKQEKK